MCLCLCLAYAFTNCESEFHFSDISGWKSYVPIICDFPLKNGFHLISYLDFIAFRSCFVLVKHGLQYEPNGFSIEFLCGSDVLPRCN